MSLITFKIATPKHVVVSDTAYMVVLPDTKGLLGVMELHMAMLGRLKPGVIYVYDTELHVKQRVFCHGGFFRFTDKNELIILANDIKQLDDLNRSEAEKLLAEWEAKILDTDRHEELEKIFWNIDIYRAAIQATYDVVR